MTQHIPLPQGERFDSKKAAKLRTYFQIALVGGLIGAGITFFFSAKLAAHGWLFGFFYAFTVLVGCFFWNCLHHATDAEWSVVVRRQIENLSALLKWAWVLFIPLAAICIYDHSQKPGHALLYEWMTHPVTGSQAKYLNQPFFWSRAACFFGFLAVLATALRNYSIAQDKNGASANTFFMRRLGIAGIPTLAICLTFGGIDWMKSLNQHWYSTMWGVYLFAGAAGASMALIVLTCKWLQSLGYLKPVNDQHYHLMGKFLLAFTIFWAYIGFSQYMLITYANIPEETIYFRLRNAESWQWLGVFLVFGRFFFMFVPLLFQGLKKNKGIVFCAAWMLFMQFVDLFIIIIPEYDPAGISIPGLLACVFSLLAVVGVLGLGFLKHLSQGCVFPTKDPRLAESIKFSN